jgi:hypothetical protein
METYLIGLLIILIVILIGLVYFMSKQVRENDTKLKINIKDLEALRNKVAEMDALLNTQFHQDQQIQFDGEMFEREEQELTQEVADEEDVDLDDPEYDVDEPEIEDITEVSDVNEAVPEETVDEEESVPEKTVDEEEAVPEETVDEEEAVPEETVDVEEAVPEETVDILEKVLEKPKKKKKYKQPTNKAKDYEVGHRMESDNDGEIYEVVTDSRNRPRWKRVIE